MEKDDLKFKIKKIMSEVWEVSVDNIPEDASFNDYLYWDSIGHVSLMVALQEQFGIEIDYEVLIKFVSIAEIVNGIWGKRFGSNTIKL